MRCDEEKYVNIEVKYTNFEEGLGHYQNEINDVCKDFEERRNEIESLDQSHKQKCKMVGMAEKIRDKHINEINELWNKEYNMIEQEFQKELINASYLDNESAKIIYDKVVKDKLDYLHNEFGYDEGDRFNFYGIIEDFIDFENLIISLKCCKIEK